MREVNIQMFNLHMAKRLVYMQKCFAILMDRLEEVGFDTSTEHPDTAILLIGRGGSDDDANSDFYKITRLLWEKLNVKWVESAFMGVTAPLSG